MGSKRTWIASAAAAMAAAAALLSLPAQARVDASVYVQVAPPAPRYEVVPAPRHGHDWVPGHWEWRRHAYVWVPGVFVTARPGYYYAQPQWVQYGNRWGYHGGGWHRGHGHGRGDRDHDGVANRYDRDRDGDGVANRYDRRPDNRNRH